MLPPWLLIALFLLAVFRVTRFIGSDTFPPIAWLRWRLVRNHLDAKAPEWGGDHAQIHWLRYLIGDNVNGGCPWCISIYVGGAGSALLWFGTHWHWWLLVILWLASSAVTGFLSQLED